MYIHAAGKGLCIQIPIETPTICISEWKPTLLCQKKPKFTQGKKVYYNSYCQLWVFTYVAFLYSIWQKLNVFLFKLNRLTSSRQTLYKRKSNLNPLEAHPLLIYLFWEIIIDNRSRHILKVKTCYIPKSDLFNIFAAERGELINVFRYICKENGDTYSINCCNYKRLVPPKWCLNNNEMTNNKRYIYCVFVKYYVFLKTFD